MEPVVHARALIHGRDAMTREETFAQVAITVHGSPVGRVVVLGKIEDRGTLGRRRVAWPDPDQSEIFPHRIAANAGLRRNPLLSGDAHTAPCPVECHAMVTALNVVALDGAK